MNRRRGFVLVEAVVAIALVGLVAVAAMRLARVLSASADQRRDLVRSLYLAEAVASEAKTMGAITEPQEGRFDLHPDYAYRLLPGTEDGPSAVVILGPRGERIFALVPEGEPEPLYSEEEALAR